MRDFREYALYELVHPQTTPVIIPKGGYSQETVLRFSFVATPASRGQDTFRFWETISLGAIPIVLAGPLDFFMPTCHASSLTAGSISQRQSFSVGAVRSSNASARSRFSTRASFLNSSFYAQRIERGEAVLRRGAGRHQHERAAILNHTCNLTLGGGMPTGSYGVRDGGLAARHADLGCAQ
eukprot:7378161-Prymnesium_polylepis.1